MSSSDEGWNCLRCGDCYVDGHHVTYEETHVNCGGRCEPNETGKTKPTIPAPEIAALAREIDANLKDIKHENGLTDYQDTCVDESLEKVAALLKLAEPENEG